MRPGEVAEYLSIHLQTVYRLINSRQLPAAKLKGVGWRIDRKQLDALMEREIEERDRRWKNLFGGK
jgi:excisionase family DNA binding protein